MEWREGTKFSLPPNGPIDCVDFMASIDWLKIMINNVDCISQGRQNSDFPIKENASSITREIEILIGTVGNTTAAKLWGRLILKFLVSLIRLCIA